MKPNGYRHARLYGHNYRVYIKEIGSYTVRCWVKDRSLEIEDWYGYTENVVEWYIENRKTSRDYEVLALNIETGSVEIEKLSWEDRMDVEKRKEFYRVHRSIYITHNFDEVIKEVNWLTA
jgi:hypothetical protein